MNLTEIESVRKSVGQWEWLAGTGKRKHEWPEWVWNGGQYAAVTADCFLCEYAKDKLGGCRACPYYKKYGHCMNLKSPYRRWICVRTEEDKKKYARRIVEQLKEILWTWTGRE